MPVELELDFIILSIPDIHPEIPFKSPKLRADYISIILIKDGSGTYFLDDNKFPFLLAEIVPPQKMPETNFEEFNILYKQILNEFNSKRTLFILFIEFNVNITING